MKVIVNLPSGVDITVESEEALEVASVMEELYRAGIVPGKRSGGLLQAAAESLKAHGAGKPIKLVDDEGPWWRAKQAAEKWEAARMPVPAEAYHRIPHLFESTKADADAGITDRRTAYGMACLSPDTCQREGGRCAFRPIPEGGTAAGFASDE